MASLLLPGLGHVLMGRFARALIWLAGTLAIGFIIREETSELSTQLLFLQAAVNVFAAIDICLLIKTQGAVPRRR
ncbi:MAG: hypothetical protein QOD86_2637 [Miltoncostaeaceae bacterium]|nr:hypothetical protein [Miltoncostaeaceae bacterium]